MCIGVVCQRVTGDIVTETLKSRRLAGFLALGRPTLRPTFTDENEWCAFCSDRRSLVPL
ncbi:hypothetical protein X777_16909 [Ooceraea biroi]|uniref:Uncharacterized protein n=1 Tax=Ooceraea biroi TaxID=2015173 RepID=A0A026WSC6_OOCBI|nr:hypothetical protein X777_16909 [Ooceraea biroi]